MPIAGPLAFFGAGVQTYGTKTTVKGAAPVKIKEEKRSLLERLLEPGEKAGAVEKSLLPELFEDRLTLYKDAVRETKGYRDKKIKALYGE